MTEYKRILDSVHGYINIPCLYCDNIIDTIYFQRLRRIEQTSGRSLFPSAHHDRFIHSLGVYHLGQKIVDSIKRRYKGKQFTDYDDVVYESYILACLLHDVCHSPFSHTFENFYEKGNDLRGILIEAMKNDEFTSDWNSCFENCAPHEIMSAYLTLQVFSDWITNNTKANIQLIVRMIIGCKFIQSYQTKSFENSFIDLIHGDIIDADGLDYACRDAWASGYCTNNIDVDRLIDSIHIEKNAENLYTVCYTTKAQNDYNTAFRNYLSNADGKNYYQLFKEATDKAPNETFEDWLYRTNMNAYNKANEAGIAAAGETRWNGAISALNWFRLPDYPGLVSNMPTSQTNVPLGSFKSGGKTPKYMQRHTGQKPDEAIWIQRNKDTAKALEKLHDAVIKLFMKTLS